MTRALLDTLYTTPKPGLVDRYNNGGRKNMTLATFEASTKALRPFWGRCMEIGQGGKERAGAASKWAEELLYRCDYLPLTAVEVLNRKFVAENLSPGGCADLLAAALFLYSL